MSVQGQRGLLPAGAGVLTILFINVFIGIVAARMGFQVAGDLQLFVWIGSILTGIIVTIMLQNA